MKKIIILSIIFSVNFIFSEEKKLELSMLRGGMFLSTMGYDGICISPMIDFYTSNNIKFYFGCDLAIGPGFLFYGSFGTGKEYYFRNKQFSIETIFLINLGTYYAGSIDDNKLYGLQAISRLNFLPVESCKIFIESGIEFDFFSSAQVLIPLLPIRIGMTFRF
ncbi:MAG: hypothetical protein ACP5Q5_00730 [Brevinematia bacterium]